MQLNEGKFKVLMKIDAWTIQDSEVSEGGHVTSFWLWLRRMD